MSPINGQGLFFLLLAPSISTLMIETARLCQSLRLAGSLYAKGGSLCLRAS